MSEMSADYFNRIYMQLPIFRVDIRDKITQN